MHVLGLDIGGSGIKGAPIDVSTGTLAADRYRIPTPHPAEPAAMIDTMGRIVRHFDWSGPVGCGFPAVVKEGVVYTAANISPQWIGVSGKMLLEQATGCPAVFLNDADAAGIAEMRFGAGRNQPGLVLIVTVGTGLGTALFMDGRLIPNTELGHIELHGKDAELYASDAVRKRNSLTWEEWGDRLESYLRTMEQLLWPDLIIIGGGVSKKQDKYFASLHLRTRFVAAQLRNEAGMVGAALAAHETLPHPTPARTNATDA